MSNSEIQSINGMPLCDDKARDAVKTKASDFIVTDNSTYIQLANEDGDPIGTKIVFPRGEKGEKGDKGDTGSSPTLSIGEVTTLENNQAAEAVLESGDDGYVLNLGIPKGMNGTSVVADDGQITIVNDFTTGGTDTVASGETVKVLSSQVEEVRKKPEGLLYEDEYLYLTHNGQIVSDGVHVISATSGGGSGSGGGSDNGAVMTITKLDQWISKSIAAGSSCTVNFNWTSIENEISTGNGTLFIYVNNVIKSTKEIKQGDNSIEITDYLSTGANTVKLQVTDLYGNKKIINYNITVMTLTIESNFNYKEIYDDKIPFAFTCYGEIEKIVTFRIDGKEVGSMSVTTSGRQSSYMIPAQLHGSHNLDVWFTCTIDDQSIESNKLHYDIACVEENEDKIIITSNFMQDTVQQYAVTNISYTVYNPNSLYTSEVLLYENGHLLSTLKNVGRSEQIWNYMANTSGEKTLEIKAGDTVKTFSLTAEKSNVDVQEATDNMKLYLTSQGRSNNDTNKTIWKYNDISCQMENFNYSSDGWVTDDDGLPVLRLMGDDRIIIPYKPFESDCRLTGKTIEIEFATHSILNYDTTVISCIDSDNDRGFKITPQKATFHASQTETSTQFKEDEHIRLSFIVEKNTDNKLVMFYINAIMSNPVMYASDEDFSQPTPQNITIGSNDCVTDIYCIRIYDNNLTRYEILDNWIYDTADGKLKADRYNRNNIYDAYGKIVVDKLPKYLPYMVVKAPELPQYKGDKKTVDGYFVDQIRPEKSFSWTGAQFNVQGTSSQYYPRKNYKAKFKNGVVLSDGTTSKKYALRDGMIEENEFTLKADVASSEGCNNTELVRLYNDACPFKTPYQEADSRHRQGIDGFPMVIFWDSGDGELQFIGKYNFNLDKGNNDTWGFESGDESWEICNNTSPRSLFKSNDFESMSTDENNNPVLAWLGDFESRYPEENDDGTLYQDGTRLKALLTWTKSTDRNQATNEDLPEPVTLYSPWRTDVFTTDEDGNKTIVTNIEYTKDDANYRLAKFRNELPDHCEVESLEFYYLYTELLLLIDSRAKNAFPSLVGSDKWCMLPYDMDTALGINNEGLLVFGPYLEDVDTLASSTVFNGQDSVLWCNLRDTYGTEIKQMYQELRSQNVLSYDVIENAFASHQAIWGEAIFNEDSYYKYIEPLIKESKLTYLGMAQGSKAEQRKWWLYNRFRYMDSKFSAGNAETDVLTIRAYQKSNFVITPFNDIYISARYGSNMVQVRGKAGQSYPLECPIENFNDTECYVFSASQVKELGDLSGFKPGTVDLTHATRLQSVSIGNATEGYSNANLTNLSFGADVTEGKPVDVLLKKADIRNCPNLSGSINMSNCPYLEEAYYSGTSITGLNLPKTSTIRILDLPDTMTNLTIINQQKLEQLNLNSYSQLDLVRIEQPSTYMNEQLPTIIEGMSANHKLRVIDFNMSFESEDALKTFISKLDTLKGVDENGSNTERAQMVGTVRVGGTVTGATTKDIYDKYPNLIIKGDTMIINLYFYDSDKETLLYTETINKDDYPEEPVSAGYIEAPNIEISAKYVYVFKKWNLNLNQRFDYDQILYPVFEETIRQYKANFYNSSTLLESNLTNYGECPKYNGNTDYLINQDVPVGDNTDYKFFVWEPSIYEPMYNDTDYHATYRYTKCIYPNDIADLADVTENFKLTNDFTADDTWTKVNVGYYDYYKKANGNAYTNNDGENVSLYDIVFYTKGYIVFGDCGSLFEDFSHMKTCDLTRIDTTFATNFAYMFKNCSALTSLTGTTAIKTNNATTMFQMFCGCSSLTQLDVSSFDTAKVGSFNSMFFNCGSLVNLDIKNFNFVSAFSCASMFYGCKKLTTLTTGNMYSNADSNELLNLFYDCNSLTAADLSTMNFSNLNNINSVFSYCNNLTKVDLGMFDISASKLQSNVQMELDVRTTVKDVYIHAATPPVISENIKFNIISGFTIHIPKGSMLAYKKATNWCLYADCFVEDESTEYTWSKELSNKIHRYNNIVFDKIVPTSYLYCLPLISYNADDIKAYISESNCIVTSGSEDKVIYTPKDSSSLFELNSPGPVANWRSFTFNNFNTSRTTNMSSMFSSCRYVNSFDLSSFDTSSLATVFAMFMWCDNLKSVNFGENFDTSRCPDFGFMFFFDKALVTVDWEHLDTSALNSMDLFLDCCNSVKSVDLKTFDMSRLKKLYSPFYQCLEMTDIDLGNFSVSGVTDFTYLFISCPKLTSITIHSATPATLSAANIFPTNEGMKIYIPVGSIDAYKAATNWATYADYFEEKEGVEPIIFEEA